jgi:hypothetical protein
MHVEWLFIFKPFGEEEEEEEEEKNVFSTVKTCVD